MLMVGSLDDVKMNTGANQGAVSKADSFKIWWFWFAIHWLLIDMFRLLVSYRCLDSSGSHSFFFLTGPLCIFWTLQGILVRSTIWSHLMNRATTVYHGLLTIDMVIINQTSTFLGLIPLKNGSTKQGNLHVVIQWGVSARYLKFLCRFFWCFKLGTRFLF